MTSTLVEQLRALPDDGLGALLQLRPDLVVPVPADVSQLAARAQSRVSVARALDGLDRFTLEVLDGLRYVRGEGGHASVDTLLTLAAEAGAEPSQVRAAVDRLRARFLVYGSDSIVRLVGAIDELTSPYPVGLGRPAAELVDKSAVVRVGARGRATGTTESADAADPAELVEDAAGLRRMLLSAPPEARAVLDRLADGPPIGSVGLRSSAEDSPVRWLVAHGLLVAIADDMVELPREVGIVLRRDTGPLGQLHPEPPPLDPVARSGVDSAAAGQAMEAVRHLDALLHAIAETPPPLLRAFGLGIRDLRRLARQCGISDAATALLLEIAYAAGLLTYVDALSQSGESQWLPAPEYDSWRTAPLARQWVMLARTWLQMTRAPVLVGQRDERDKPISALSVDGARGGAPASRRAALSVLAGVPTGMAVTIDAVLARLAWQSPRRYLRPAAAGADLLARAALTEAAELGITGLDSMTTYGRLLLSEQPDDVDNDPLGIRAEPDPVVAALDALLPAPVDHLLVQADLTVIIPGPPEPALAAELAALADAESRGGATVYRVTPVSVRRALDAGYSPADIHGLLRRRSRTPLPQTLEYLIDDVARRHGGLRVSTASSYLRSDDEALVSEVLADRRLSGLTLRRLAPTVLACPHPTHRLLDLLRDAGYAPVAEDATGATVLSRPIVARAPTRPVRRPIHVDDPDRQRLSGPRLAGVVEQIRRGDRLARAARRSPLSKPHVDADGQPIDSSQAHAQALAVLRQGITEKKLVWVGFVDAHGSTGSRLVRPVSMGGGFLHAEDDRNQTRHTFALHRITAAALEP
jgi:Helicase conserved C-terminal domain